MLKFPNSKRYSALASSGAAVCQRASRVGIAAMMLGLAQVASAAVVYTNGAPDQLNGTNMSANPIAEDFIIGATTDITNIRFWAIQSAASDYSGNLFWAIYSNGVAQPGVLVQGGAAVAVTATPTGGSTGFGYSEFVFDIAANFQLTAGTYWLGLANDPLDPVNPSEMLWETTSAGGGSTGLYNDTGTWIDSLNHHAFLLEGRLVGDPPPTDVPEPSTLALLACGLLVARLARRRPLAAPTIQFRSSKCANFF